MRLVFAGTPEVALPSLRALLASHHDVVGVLTRPDARAGRGRTLRPSPVRAEAESFGVPVLTPASAREPGLTDALAKLAPDACPVVAYGALLPSGLLQVPRHGWVNLHFSLLPSWRGAAPVQHALLAGDEVTGASTFVLDEGMDTGPVLGTLTETIRPGDTAGELLGRLARAGAQLLVRTLDGVERGELSARPQPVEGVSYAPKLTAADARVDWSRPAYAVDRLVRGCTPEPGAWTTFRGARFGLGPVRPVAVRPHLGPGELAVDRTGVQVGTGAGTVLLGSVQPQGKRPMPAADWARGARPEAGERLGG